MLWVCRVKSASVKHAVWTIVTAVMLLQVAAALPCRRFPSECWLPYRMQGQS